MTTVPSSEPSNIKTQPEGQRAFWRIFWASALILAGVILLAGQFGLFPTYGNASTWDWIMLGGGFLLLVTETARTLSPDLGRPSAGRLIVGFVLIGLGASRIFDLTLQVAWPVILIVIGVATLVGNMARRR